MTRHIHVIGIRKTEPDIRLYVLALIALARQLQAQAATPDEPTPTRSESGGVDHD